jgi:hypothetical protein
MEMHKWECEKCNWKGDEPIVAHPEYEDGGYQACPNGCTDDRDGEPLGTILNFNHPGNQIKYLNAMFNSNY